MLMRFMYLSYMPYSTRVRFASCCQGCVGCLLPPFFLLVLSRMPPELLLLLLLGPVAWALQVEHCCQYLLLLPRQLVCAAVLLLLRLS